MATRLVLGCGTISQALVSSLTERSGTVVVLDADEGAIQTLREEGVTAEVVDVTDAAALREATPDLAPDTVAVATDDGERTLAVARAARSVFPDAYLLAYAGLASALPADVEAIADDVVSPLAETTDFLMERIGDAGVRTRKLMAILRGIDDRLAVVTHDNPDPDAIASAVALTRVARAAGCAADVCYYGDITHQENRAFVNLLDYDLRNLDPDADLSEYDAFALVDHSQPGVNDGLPEDTPIDVVIDHHPPRFPVEARFVDLRSEVGATSTLLVDYLRDLGLTPDEAVATGLLFGIRVDTDGFTREVSADDFEAAAYLQDRADLGTLERIESPSMSPDTLDTIARAIANRDRHGPVVVTSVGSLSDRDALAQAADRLLNIDGVTTTFVFGIAEDTVYASARARGTDIDLGETLRDAFCQIGSAGGHADMAGAQIPLGMLDSAADEESLTSVVEAVISDRFLEALDSRTHRVIHDVYPDSFHGVEDLDSDVSDVVDSARDAYGAQSGDEGGTQSGDEGGAQSGTESADGSGTESAGDVPTDGDDGRGESDG